jgi:hypothetical protein
MSKKLYRETMANFARYLTVGDVLAAIERLGGNGDTVSFCALERALRSVILKMQQLQGKMEQQLYWLLQKMALRGFVCIQWGSHFTAIEQVSLTPECLPALVAAVRYSSFSE